MYRNETQGQKEQGSGLPIGDMNQILSQEADGQVIIDFAEQRTLTPNWLQKTQRTRRYNGPTASTGN